MYKWVVYKLKGKHTPQVMNEILKHVISNIIRRFLILHNFSTDKKHLIISHKAHLIDEFLII